MTKSLPIVGLGSPGTYYLIGNNWYKGDTGVQVLDFDDWRTMELGKSTGNGPIFHPAIDGKVYYRVGDYWIETSPGSLTLVENASDEYRAIQTKLREQPHRRTYDASAEWRLMEL